MSLTNDVRVELYSFFRDAGRAPDIAELASAVSASPEETTAALLSLAAEDVIALWPGTQDVWLAHPFCARGGAFTVRAGARQWEAICIWDALGVLAVVESDGTVRTGCPDCGEQLVVGVTHGDIWGPPEAVVHFGVPSRLWYEDVGFT